MLRLDERSERKLFEECPELFGNKAPRRIKYGRSHPSWDRRQKRRGKKSKAEEAKLKVKLSGHGRQIILRGEDAN